MTLEQRPGGDEEASQQPAGEALPVRRRAGAKALRAQGARVPGAHEAPRGGWEGSRRGGRGVRRYQGRKGTEHAAPLYADSSPAL